MTRTPGPDSDEPFTLKQSFLLDMPKPVAARGELICADSNRTVIKLFSGSKAHLGNDIALAWAGELSTPALRQMGAHWRISLEAPECKGDGAYSLQRVTPRGIELSTPFAPVKLGLDAVEWSQS